MTGWKIEINNKERGNVRLGQFFHFIDVFPALLLTTAHKMATDTTRGSSGVSFGFSKIIQKSKVVKTDTNKKTFEENDDSRPQETDFVKEVNDRDGVKGSIVKEVKKDLVIECKGNTLQLRAKVQKKQETEVKRELGTTEDDAAEREILNDLEKWKEDQENRNEESEKKNFDLVVPLDEKSASTAEEPDDVTGVEEAEQSTLDDYDAIPVEGFGMGMLRGMGFKAGEGIGGFKKADIKCIDPVMRPKGLGLGATRPNSGSNSDSKASKDEDGKELKMENGAHVLLVGGPHRDMYGQVEGVDGEAARVFVKLAVGGQTVSVSENVAKLVSKKEYKKYAKVINKDMYEKYNEKQKAREVEWDKGKGERASEKDSKKRSKDRSRSRSNSPESKKYKKSSSSSSSNGHSSSRPRRSWVRPLLRVRYIDKHYKGGKYYNTKVVVEDVAAENSCTLRTESGSVIDGVSPKQIETLIPKNVGGVVMILSGSRKGQVAELVAKDKRSCVAAVQTLPDKDEVLKLDFDDVCEYTGEVFDY